MALLFFAVIGAEFLLRYFYDRPIRHVNSLRGEADRNTRLQILGLVTMTIFLLIRSVYRIIELAGGWDGKTIATQWLFSSSMLNHLLPLQVLILVPLADTFDGSMIILAAFTLNFLHPGMLLAEYNRIQRVDVGVLGGKEKTTGSPSVGSL